MFYNTGDGQAIIARQLRLQEFLFVSFLCVFVGYPGWLRSLFTAVLKHRRRLRPASPD